MSCLSMIVAVANNGVIGVNNTLPWHLPEDLKRFRALTMGHHIIMGRKTYESLGRLLPGRTTVIVTRNPSYQVDGAQVVHSLEQALRFCTYDGELFLIGGAQLYQEGLQHVQKLYITRVDIEVVGDAFLPDIDFNAWTLKEKKDHQSTSGLFYSDLTYLRK
ncbi:MAG: diacylglycerol kinase [Methylophilales bacterium 28-44-11]|nr:MAG: diacylglycerol kinase [Methylophilales bacterium 28-44-11]